MVHHFLWWFYDNGMDYMFDPWSTRAVGIKFFARKMKIMIACLDTVHGFILGESKNILNFFYDTRKLNTVSFPKNSTKLTKTSKWLSDWNYFKQENVVIFHLKNPDTVIINQKHKNSVKILHITTIVFYSFTMYKFIYNNQLTNS